MTKLTDEPRDGFVVWYDPNGDPFAVFWKNPDRDYLGENWVNTDLWSDPDSEPLPWLELIQEMDGFNGPYRLVQA